MTDMIKLVDRTEEKMALAEELGLTSYVNSRKGALKAKQEKKAREEALAELTKMNFKPLDWGKVNKMFPSHVWVWKRFLSNPNGMRYAPITSATLAAGLGWPLLAASTTGLEHPWRFFGIFAGLIWSPFLIGTLINSCLLSLVEVRIVTDWLKDWSAELPYGALLAMKEAKELGVETFKEDVWLSDWQSYDPNNPQHKNKVLHGSNYGTGFSVDLGIGERRDNGFKIIYPKLGPERLKQDPIIVGLYKDVEVEIFAWDDRKVYE